MATEDVIGEMFLAEDEHVNVLMEEERRFWDQAVIAFITTRSSEESEKRPIGVIATTAAACADALLNERRHRFGEGYPNDEWKPGQKEA